MVIAPSARSMLAGDIAVAVDRLILLLEQFARESRVAVARTEISGFVDPEEDWSQLFITQWVDLPPDEAQEYWDQVGQRYEQWLATLPEGVAALLRERVTIEVEWNR